MSCYTPASTARGRSPSPAENSTQEFKELIDRNYVSSVDPLAKQSPQLSNFEWFAPWEEFINRSAAGTPTIHSDTINSLFQYFQTPIDTYEQQRQLSLIVADLKHKCHRWPTDSQVDVGLMRASGLVQEHPKQAQGLLALVLNTFHEELRIMGTRLSVRALDMACMIYSATGRADTAMTVLERLIPLIEQDPELVREGYHTRSRVHLEFLDGVTVYDEATSRMMCKFFTGVRSHTAFNILVLGFG